MIVEIRQSISASRDEVWPVIAELDQIARWTPTVVEFSLSRPRRVRRGARFAETHWLLGARHFTGKLTEWNEGESWAIASHPVCESDWPYLPHHVRWSLSGGLPAETQLCIRMAYRTNRGSRGCILDKLMQPFAKLALRLLAYRVKRAVRGRLVVNSGGP